jgi:hypothetical protein
MIILSVGMPRAGSGWFYNLTNDLMLASGAQNARQIRKKYHLQAILTEVNCNIGALTAKRLLPVLIPSLTGNTFVIKAHAGPTHLASQVIQFGWIRPTYIYRDPRDAMLSALENGQRARQQNRKNAFSHLVDFKTALDFIQDYLIIWEKWIQNESTFKIRYEDLLEKYDVEAERLVTFLGLTKDKTINTAISRVIAKYRPESAKTDRKGLHFSHGKIGRFRQKMTAEQQEFLAERFDHYLKRMGYQV